MYAPNQERHTCDEREKPHESRNAKKWPWIGRRIACVRSCSISSVIVTWPLSLVENIPLGALLRESGDVESYLQLLKTFKQDWSYHNREAGMESDLMKIKAWYQALDEEMGATLAAFSDEDLSRTIDPRGFTVDLRRLPASPADLRWQSKRLFQGDEQGVAPVISGIYWLSKVRAKKDTLTALPRWWQYRG